MYYIVYETTNNINGRIYIGAHITSCIDDGYIGSGKVLCRAIKKYGIENFTRKVLFMFDNADDMFLKEKEIVNEDFVKRKDTYNIKVGGYGGWDFVNASGLNWSPEKNKRISPFKNSTPEQKKEWEAKKIESLRKTWQKIKNGELVDKHPCRATFKGKAHTDETKQKMSATHKKNKDNVGEKNSQYGTCWINNGIKNLKIKKSELDSYLLRGYKKGRINAFKNIKKKD